MKTKKKVKVAQSVIPRVDFFSPDKNFHSHITHSSYQKTLCKQYYI
jgi:hypothetical protein